MEESYEKGNFGASLHYPCCKRSFRYGRLLLRGARGNSGVILSLLFRGIAKSLKDRETIDGRDLAIALDFGVAAAYKAVMKPAEGTILTVSRLTAARAADAARQTPNDPEAVLEAAKVPEFCLS